MLCLVHDSFKNGIPVITLLAVCETLYYPTNALHYMNCRLLKTHYIYKSSRMMIRAWTETCRSSFYVFNVFI